ncbi:MAG: hypothetical protein ACR2JI_15280 [Mycobacterium sp.]
MNGRIARSISTALAGSALAAGIFLGSIGLGAAAQASPTDAGASTCNMTMPTNVAPAAGAPNNMTRAGMINRLNPVTPGTNSGMDAACTAS